MSTSSCSKTSGVLGGLLGRADATHSRLSGPLNDNLRTQHSSSILASVLGAVAGRIEVTNTTKNTPSRGPGRGSGGVQAWAIAVVRSVPASACVCPGLQRQRAVCQHRLAAIAGGVPVPKLLQMGQRQQQAGGGFVNHCSERIADWVGKGKCALFVRRKKGPDTHTGVGPSRDSKSIGKKDSRDVA